MEEIENKVAKSQLINLDISDFYPKSKRIGIDFKDFLEEGIILKEKNYREKLKTTDFSVYEKSYVYVYSSTDAIVPLWAYFLLTSYLQEFSEGVFYGSLEQLNDFLICKEIQNFDFSVYKDKKVLVKGCSQLQIPNNSYVQLVQHLQKVVQSLMFGEACSNVPIYKKKNNN